jgi:protein involved in polysaccharide export with SLBB domain
MPQPNRPPKIQGKMETTMKMLVSATLVLSASLAMTASGQVKSVAAANNQGGSKLATDQAPATATRARVLRQTPDVAKPKSDFNNHSGANRLATSNAAVLTADAGRGTSTNNSPAGSKIGHSSLKPAGNPANAVASPVKALPPTPAPVATGPTQTYRVGSGDVLDIQISAASGGRSTLFTVLEDGALEYPLAGDPIIVGGLTTNEIAALLRQRIRIFDNPIVTVGVRDYASHAVSVTGFVAAPGTKTLRREAVPLYTMLAEALVLPEAARATITREGVAPIVVDLKDIKLAGTLIVPGDAIKVSGQPATPTEFFFVGGEISSPGQKPFYAGLTLTQAILASGGTKSSAGAKVRVSRQGADGRLTSEEFNLRKIQAGKIPDPVLQKGDRIEVTTGN